MAASFNLFTGARAALALPGTSTLLASLSGVRSLSLAIFSSLEPGQQWRCPAPRRCLLSLSGVRSLSLAIPPFTGARAALALPGTSTLLASLGGVRSLSLAITPLLEPGQQWRCLAPRRCLLA
jgi:hypothetical protein